MLAGQAQKEFFFNEALSVADALLHLAVESVSQAPPSNPENGQCWIVAPSSQGEWVGQEHALAFRMSDEWKFINAVNGMSAFDKSSGQRFFFDSIWKNAIEPVAPQGGSTVDSEARIAIAALIEGIRELGGFPRN